MLAGYVCCIVIDAMSLTDTSRSLLNPYRLDILLHCSADIGPNGPSPLSNQFLIVRYFHNCEQIGQRYMTCINQGHEVKVIYHDGIHSGSSSATHTIILKLIHETCSTVDV